MIRLLITLLIVGALAFIIMSSNDKNIGDAFKFMEKEGVITEKQSSSRDFKALTSKFKESADEYSKSTEKRLSELEM